MKKTWSTLVRNLFLGRRANSPSRKKAVAKRRQPQLETLEDRTVPAIGFFQGFEVDTTGWNVFGSAVFNSATR
jgi:hypothetical protein